MIKNFKNFSFLILLVFIVTGCSNKIYPYKIADTVKNKEISDIELKKMNVKQFYDFIKIKEDREDITAYVPSKSFYFINRYCKLKNSRLRKYTDVDKSVDVLSIEGNLMASNRIVDYSTQFGCYIESTDEYIELIRVDSHTRRFKNQYRDNVVSISKFSKKSYLSFMDDRKKDAEKREKAIEASYQERKMLRERKGTHAIVFYNSFRFNGERKYENICVKSCKNFNIDNTGYVSLQKSLDDNWKFVSKIGNINTSINKYCTCEGINVLMKK